MSTKKHYEKYWTSKDKKEEFFDYERNWVLPGLFGKKEMVLDLGCGDGAVSEFLQKVLGMDIVGADMSSKALKVAKERGVKVVQVDVEKTLPFEDEAFDTVFWGDNVEHLFSPQKTLVEVRRVLKKEGRLILSCPNMGYWRYRLYYFFNGQLPDTEWTGNPAWTWSHIRFFNKKILADFLESENFKIRKVIGVSKRFPDIRILPRFPEIFGMILVVEAIKNG